VKSGEHGGEFTSKPQAAGEALKRKFETGLNRVPKTGSGFMYHMTPAKNRAAIAAGGLDTGKGKYGRRIYLTEEPAGGGTPPANWDVHRVDVSGVKLYPDYVDGVGSWYTEEPLPAGRVSLHRGEQAGRAGQPSFTYSGETYGPTGYVRVTRKVTGPFYHGRRTRHAAGALVRPGKVHNPWGDEFDERGRSVYSYFATDPQTAVSYAEQTGGFLYEVAPTGDAGWDSRGGDGSYQTRAPLKILRRIPPEEWGSLPAGSDVKVPEAPSP
jgi:hypothetical protein